MHMRVLLRVCVCVGVCGCVCVYIDAHMTLRTRHSSKFVRVCVCVFVGDVTYAPFKQLMQKSWEDDPGNEIRSLFLVSRSL